MSLILFTLMSCCDSDFVSSNISFNENKLGGIDRIMTVLTSAFERMKEKLYGFGRLYKRLWFLQQTLFTLLHETEAGTVCDHIKLNF